MSHSFTNIWIHAICGTKYREPIILPEFEERIHSHIKSELKKIECPARIVNGTEDHVHALYKQNPKISIIDVIKQIKGNTSHWINEIDSYKLKFAWQTGYGAFSVSESQIAIVEAYIINQKEHHKKQSFKEEYEFFLKMHGFDLKDIWEK
jgi:REP element-mobilizing transposase RayT